MKHAKLVIIIVSIIVLASVSFIGHKFKQTPVTYAALSNPQDFENDKEGTFMMNFQVNFDSLQQHFGMVPDYIIIFNSKLIKGLKFVYSLNEKSIEGGLPPIKTEPFELFDNQPHKLVYTFKQGIGQKFIVDGRDIGFGSFDISYSNIITANVALTPSLPVYGSLPADIEVLPVSVLQ